MVKRMNAEKKRMKEKAAEERKKALDKQLKIAQDEQAKIEEEAERKAKEKLDKREEFAKKLEEHKSFRIRNVGKERKSVSQMGTKKKLNEEDAENDPA